jgi:type VI secretion system protein ImpL
MSSWATSQLKYALGLGSIMSFYGIVGMIVLMMPEGSLGRNQKVIVIVVLVLSMPFTLLTGYIAARRSKKKAEKEKQDVPVTAGTAPVEDQPAKLAAPAGTYSDLASSTEEAVQFLKSSNLGDGGKDAIYSLPWFLIAGEPRSGKSSLVISSNLNFQTLPSQRQSEQKFIRPTPNIDWRVTSDAVFVDTAGRYQTEGADGDEWSALLENIKKYRSNRPIDGLLLVINAATVLKNDDRQNEELAKVLRSRLDDAIQRLKVRFPVYLIFTHADSIEGFRDSFSTSKNEEKTLVWGATIPLEKAENAQSLFDGEYEVLQNSVMKRRLMRLSAPFPPVRQLRIFNFPLHFGSARRKFGSFVNALFRPNPFSENPFLRGFYFTAVPENKPQQGLPQTAGQGYFTERFFRDVVLRDKDLVRTFLARRQRAPIFGWFLTIAAMSLVLLLLVLSGVSLFANRQMLEEAVVVGDKALTLRKADSGKDILAKKEDEVRQELRVLEEMRPILSTLDSYERDGAPLYMRFGMYSGNGIYNNHLLPLYFNIVEARFKAPAVKKLESELRTFAEGKGVTNSSQLTEKEEEYLDRHYNLLKAYLMLSGQHKEKAEATHLSNTLKDFWVSESKIPSDMKQTAEQHLEFWSKQVDRDANAGNFPRIDLNAKLVEDTRRKLQAFPAVYRYYSNRVTEISKEIDDKVGPTTAESILTRNGADTSFVTGSYRVPSAFTRPGFDLMKTAIAEADKKLAEDDWVMGELGKNSLAQSTDAAKLEDRYYRDYADHWRNFVKGIQIRPYKNKADATSALQSFSSANSPMKLLAREIATNTNLSAKPPATGWIDWLLSFVSKAAKTETGGTQPEKEFRPLFTFVGTPEQADNTPVEKYQAVMGRLFNDFSGVSEDRMKRIAEQMANDEDPIKIIEREKAVTSLLAGFSETSSGQELAAMLQRPIGNLKSLLGADAKSQIAKSWNEEILPAGREIEKGYPFEDGQSEADLTKLTAYLNPKDGKFSKFFDEKLSKYFEESAGQYRVKDTAEVQFTDEFITYLNKTMDLRTALFGTNPTPKFEYEFTLKPVKDAIVEVQIDGQKVTSEGTGSIKGTFPAAQSAETGVLLNVLSTGPSQAPSGVPGSAETATTGQSTAPGSSNAYQGNWGLFRFVDASRPQKQAGGEYLLTFTVSGKTVNATIKPNGGDLFDRNTFKQAKAPQTFMK